MEQGTRRPELKLRPGLTIIPMENGVQLRGGDEEIHVIHTDAPDLVEKLLWQLTRSGPAQALHDAVGPDNAALVDEVIGQLAEHHLLLDEPVDEDDEIARYLSHFGDPAPHTEVHRPTGPIGVVGHSAGVQLLARALGEHGIGVNVAENAAQLDGHANTLGKVMTCIWEQPDLDMVLRVNQAACNHRVACLFVDLSHGQHATVGPFYIPGEGACYQCFRDRLRQNSAALAELDAAQSMMLNQGAPLAGYGVLPAFRYQVVGLACGELFAFLSRHRPLRTLNRAATIDLEQLNLWTEPVWRIPWCPVCGTNR